MTLHPNFLFQRQRPGRVSTQRFHVSLVLKLSPPMKRLHAAVGNSVIVATVAAAVATACGALSSLYADTRRRGRFSPMIAGLARFPLLIPDVIIGIALLILVNLIDLGPSLAAIIIGHICHLLADFGDGHAHAISSRATEPRRGGDGPRRR